MLPVRIEDTDTLIPHTLISQASAPSGFELSPVVWLGLALAFALLLLASWSGYLFTKEQRQKTSQEVDAEAEELLRSLGFEVVERRATRRWRVEIDGEGWQTTCRSDLLVQRGRRLYVAAVKSGTAAPHQPSVRRQLLENLLAFRADGALVVDLRRRQVRTVVFGAWCEV